MIRGNRFLTVVACAALFVFSCSRKTAELRTENSLKTAGVTTTGNGSISGMLVSGKDNIGKKTVGPFARATVYLFGTDETLPVDSVRTDSHGHFDFPNLQPWLYTLSADYEGKSGGLVSEVAVVGGGETSIDIGMTRYLEHVINISTEDSLAIAGLELGFFSGRVETMQVADKDGPAFWKLKLLPGLEQKLFIRLAGKEGEKVTASIRLLFSDGKLVIGKSRKNARVEVFLRSLLEQF